MPAPVGRLKKQIEVETWNPGALSTSLSPTTATNQRNPRHVNVLAVTQDRPGQCINPAQYSWTIHFSSVGFLRRFCRAFEPGDNKAFPYFPL